MLTQFSPDNPLDIDAFSEEFDLRMRFGRGPSSTCSTIPRPTFSNSAPSYPPPPRPGSAALHQHSLPAGLPPGLQAGPGRDCLDSMSASQMSDKTGELSTSLGTDDVDSPPVANKCKHFWEYPAESNDNSVKNLLLFLDSISEISQRKNFVNTFSLFLLLPCKQHSRLRLDSQTAKPIFVLLHSWVNLYKYYLPPISSSRIISHLTSNGS